MASPASASRSRFSRFRLRARVSAPSVASKTIAEGVVSASRVVVCCGFPEKAFIILKIHNFLNDSSHESHEWLLPAIASSSHSGGTTLRHAFGGAVGNTRSRPCFFAPHQVFSSNHAKRFAPKRSPNF